jgi:hypothetical protein
MFTDMGCISKFSEWNLLKLLREGLTSAYYKMHLSYTCAGLQVYNTALYNTHIAFFASVPIAFRVRIEKPRVYDYHTRLAGI